MPPPSLPSGLDSRSRRDEAARRMLAARLADARRFQAALTRKVTPERVHDLRVATRRLRAALRAFRDLADLAALEEEVKRLQDALGEVRDLHVQGAWLEERAREAEEPERTGYHALHTRLMAPLAGRERRLGRALTRWTERTVPALEAAFERLEGPGSYGGKRVRGELRHRLRQVHRRMKDCAKKLDAPTAHALRKRAKKLRYEAELFRPALGPEVKHLLKVLEPLQEKLGDLHDADVRLELLRPLARQGPAARRAAARTLLRHVREERARQATRTQKELEDWHERKRARKLRKRLD